MMKLTKLVSAAAVAAAFSLSGCSLFRDEQAVEPQYNEPRYNAAEPIELDVSKVDIASGFTPSFKRPNVEHLFPVSIEKTAKLWAKDRLRAVDFTSPRTATYTVRDASVVETFEKADKIFYKDRVKYKANLNVTLRIADPSKGSSAETEINAWRELVIPADTDIAEKEKYWNSMVAKLFDEFDSRMAMNIHQYLNAYVRNNDHIQEF